MQPGTSAPPAAFAIVEAYWRGLLRAEATMPFMDDLNLDDLGEQAQNVAVLDVMGSPARFRFAVIGEKVKLGDPGPTPGVFLDELPPSPLLAELARQCRSVVSTASVNRGTTLAAPLWGEGAISGLLVAFPA